MSSVQPDPPDTSPEPDPPPLPEGTAFVVTMRRDGTAAVSAAVDVTRATVVRYLRLTADKLAAGQDVLDPFSAPEPSPGDPT